jgi:hypothetical protein
MGDSGGAQQIEPGFRPHALDDDQVAGRLDHLQHLHEHLPMMLSGGDMAKERSSFTPCTASVAARLMLE